MEGFNLAVATCSLLVAAATFGLHSHRTQQWRDAHKDQQMEIDEIREHLKVAEERILVLSNNDNILDDKYDAVALALSEARTKTNNAHARIEYYRDVLNIVAKTCPGRMRLPNLNGDPGKPNAENSEEAEPVPHRVPK